MLALLLFPALGWSAETWKISFDDGLGSGWRERRLSRRANRFEVVEGAAGRYLRVDSERAASALWRELDRLVHEVPFVSWRWRLERAPQHAENERERDGDDYAARLAVFFDGKPFARTTPVLMYVWAAHEPVGSRYESPYASNVSTIVLRSSAALAAQWFVERRDLVADFELAFGDRPERVTGIAIMSDTDNTDSRATALFDDLRLSPAPDAAP